MARKLLVVDDDAALCAMLIEFLHVSGFQVECEATGAAGLARVLREQFDLLILDISLPGRDGFDVLREIRQRSGMPVIILTARADRSDRVRAFDLGADDYLPKPFFPEELAARARAILRRSASQHSAMLSRLQVAGLCLLPGSRSASYQGRPLDLTAMECEVLEQLLRSAGRVVSRDELSLHLYGRQATPYDRTIDAHISHIRKKLGEARSLILSVRGAGYQICYSLDDGSEL